MPRKNNQQITKENPRAAGAPKLYEQPVRRLTARATELEIAIIRARLNARQVVEVCLAECDRLDAEKGDVKQ